MNYGRKKASQKQKKITSKSTMQGKRIGVRLFKAFLLCIVVIAVAGVGGVVVFAKKIIDNTEEITPDQVKPKGFTTFVYADDGVTEIERFVSSGSNRVYKSINEIPENLQHAFVAIEDERFYEHNGIDIQGIIRAGIVGITSGDLSQGASTLTQQLIKNNVFPNFVNEKTLYDRVERKLQEQFLAIQIEKQMDKDAIMESYLNTINLGQNCLGVQAAAKRYFGKDVSELNLSECAVIAGITQSPGKLNPITNPEDNAKRRKKVLGDMKAQGYIDQAAYDEAMADDVYSRIQTVNNTADDNSPYTYYNDALSSQVMDDLMIQLGYTETQAYTAVYSGGLSIYSTQNLAIQQICDEEVNNDANYPSLKEYGLDCAITVTRADGTVENYSSGHIKQYVKNAHGNEQGLLYPSEEAARAMVEEWKTTIAQEGDTYDERINVTPQPQASITVIDQATGQIKAMVGGRGAKATSLGLNRAYKGSKRQPGSCFKILAAYGPALDSCGKSLATVIKDEPYTLRNGKVLRNANGRYGGDTTIRKAIIWSNNVCAVKLSDEITQQLGFEYCEKFGITTLVKSKTTENGVFSDLDNQTLALGGLTDGVYNYEICAAYAAIANNGVYNSPTLYSKILDHDGNVLLEGTGETRTVIKDSTAGLLISAMQDVVNSGTGSRAKLPNMPVAGKTGTTTANKDIWFCAFTPYYTCAVWSGYDENKEMNNTVFHLQIWKAIMSRIHANLEPREFTMPPTVEQKTVCSITGQLAVSGSCPGITELFATDNPMADRCPGHGYSEPTSEEPEENEDDPDGSVDDTTDPGTSNGGDGNNGGDTPSPDTPTDPGIITPPDPPDPPEPPAPPDPTT